MTIHHPVIQLSPRWGQCKTHSSKMPQRLPSSRCIKSEPAWEFTPFLNSIAPVRFRYSTKTYGSEHRQAEPLAFYFSKGRST